MDSKRVEIVKQAFKILDTKRKGSIPLSDLLKKYNPEAHPRVQAREKTAEEVYKEFEESIQTKAYPYLTQIELMVK